MNQTKRNSPMLLYIAGGVFILWGILGLMDSNNYVAYGYQTDDNNKIVNVEPGSPAETAGMQNGDIIKTNGGIDVGNRKELAKRDRPKAGEVREYVVNRNGEDVTMELTFTGLSEKDKSLNMVAFIIGLLFILIGVWSYHKFKNMLSHAFGIFAITFGFIFMNGPHIAPGFLDNLVNSVDTAIVFFSFAFLLNYLLQYPPESKYQKWLFVPAILAAVVALGLNFMQPDGSGMLNMSIRIFFALVIIFYFLGSLITLIRKYMRSSAEERNTKGLNMMLLGTIIGLLPILIYFTLGTLSPGIQLPGNDYIFITFLAIPLFFTMALSKLSKA